MDNRRSRAAGRRRRRARVVDAFVGRTNNINGTGRESLRALRAAFAVRRGTRDLVGLTVADHIARRLTFKAVPTGTARAHAGSVVGVRHD